MRKLNRYLFVLFSIIGYTIAAQVRVDAVVDTARMRIGEQVKVDLYITYNSKIKDLKIQWPTIGDTLTGKVEVVSVSAIDTTLPEKSNSMNVYQHQQITVSVYDSGFFAIPPFQFILNNDPAQSLYTNALFLEVHTVPTDTSLKKTKDIKPPFKEEFNWKWYIHYIWWALGIIAAIILIIFLTRYFSRKKPEVVEPEKPRIPAHILALEALDRIKHEQVWKDGRTKEYYSSIADTVRLYIENRFSVNALESTTDEIMTAFRSQVVDAASKEKLHQLLMLSDLVKFAKMTPVEHEHNLALQNAYDFVNGTRRDEPVEVVEGTVGENQA